MILGIIQARMGSSRFPGKVLANLAGRPLLLHVVRRLQRSARVSRVIVAATGGPGDDVLERFCESHQVAIFRGSEQDVLDRYYRLALAEGAQTIVRVTADCPMLDAAIVDRVIDEFERGPWDYASNVIPPTFPDGLDTEVFSFQTLERTWREATLKSEREHVTPYIYNHTEMFSIGRVENPTDLSGHRWTVDHPEDLLFVAKVFELVGRPVFGMNDVLDVLKRYPEVLTINSSIKRNEGYAKSVSEDK